MPYLLKMCEDYADEFDCEQMKLVKTEKEANDIKQKIEEAGELYFGSNEFLVDVEVDIIEISSVTYDALYLHLGESFGTGVLNSVG